METWMRVGTGFAHWVKIAGSTYLTAAGGEILPKDRAVKVATEKVGIGGAPGKTFTRPVAGVEACPVCLQKAMEQGR